MKIANGFLIVCILFCLQANITVLAAVVPIADWTFVVYMQADNNLAPFAEYNIAQMQRGIVANSSRVNILIQWDQPNNKKTWRYKIVKGGKIDAGSLSIEMGTNPGKELVDCARWVKDNYPAKQYVWDLWNHGSGIQDLKQKKYPLDLTNLWLELPGLPVPYERGILYDDSQRTLLTNQALTDAFTQIKNILGKPVDIIAMDACMMAMIEVSYQLKGLAKFVVASEQIEPGAGYAYDSILNPLTKNPSTIDAKKLAQIIVNSYGSYYTAVGEKDYTSSVFDMSYLDLLKANVDTIVLNVAACKNLNTIQTKQAVTTARKKTLSFYISDYIDLYAFYQNLSAEVAAIRKKTLPSTPYAAALDTLSKAITQGMSLITRSVVANVTGPLDASAKGISIYYLNLNSPATGIHPSYFATLFAQQSLWLSFIQQYR